MSLAHEVVERAKGLSGGLHGTNGWHPEGFMYEYFPKESACPVYEEDYGDSRWESHTGYVFKLSDGSFVEFEYASGLTEMQDHRGIEGVSVVEPYEVTITKYRSVK